MILSRTGVSILALKLMPIRQVGVEWLSGLICTRICEFPGLDLRQKSHIMGLLWLFLVPRGKHGYSTYYCTCFHTVSSHLSLFILSFDFSWVCISVV